MQVPQRAGRARIAVIVAVTALSIAVSGRWCAAAEKADPNDRMKALLKERVDTTKAIYDVLLEKYNRGAGNIGSVHRAKMAWLNARGSRPHGDQKGTAENLRGDRQRFQGVGADRPSEYRNGRRRRQTRVACSPRAPSASKRRSLSNTPAPNWKWRKFPLPSHELPPLLIAQGGYGIDARRPPRGEDRRQCRDHHGEHDDAHRQPPRENEQRFL